VVGASFSRHAQGGGIWPDGAGMPVRRRKRPFNEVDDERLLDGLPG
jgi:hypothetical protein